MSRYGRWPEAAGGGAGLRQGEEPDFGAGTGGLAKLTAELYALQGKVKTLPTAKDLTEESNRRIALEAELDAAMQRMDDSDARLKKLEDKVRTWHDEIVEDVSREMLGFQARAVQPLEAQVREMKSTFPEVKRQAEAAVRTAIAAQDMQAQLRSQLQALADDTHAAVSRLAEQLGAEQRDHAEAIENLMEMVEHTATHDELSSALQGMTADLDGRTTELGGQISATTARVDAVEQELERSVQELSHAVDEQVGGLDAQLRGSIDELGSEMRDQVAQLGHDGQEMTSKTSMKIDSMSADLELLARRCVALEETTGSIASAKTRDDIVQKLSQQMLSLETKLENTAQVLHQKVELTAEEMDRQLDQTATSVDSKLAKGARDAATRADLAVKSMQQDFAEEKALLDSEVIKLKSIIERQEKRLLSTLSDDAKVNMSRLKAEVGAVKGTVDERIGQVLAQIERKMEDSQHRMDVSSDRVDDMGLRVKEAAQESMDRTAEVMNRLDEMRKQLEEQIQQLEMTAASSLKMEVTKLDAEIGAERQSSQSALQRLERKCTTDTDAVKKNQEERFDKIKDVVATLDRKLGVRCANIEASLADQHAHFTAQFTAAEGRANDKNVSLQSTVKELADTVNANQRAAAAAQTSGENKFDQRFRHQESQLESRCAALAESNARLELRLSEYKEKVDASMNERHAQLEEKILKTRTDMNERHAQLDQRYSESQSDFEDKLLQKQASQETRLDQVLSTLRTTEAQCVRTETELERLSSNAKDMREHFTKLNGDQEKALEGQRLDMTAVMDDVKGRVAQNFAHFTNIAGGLEAKTTGIESKIVSMVQSIADTREKFSGLCSRLETDIREDRRLNTEALNEQAARTTAIKTDTETKIQSLRQQVVDGHLNLDSKFLEKFAIAEGRANDQHQNAMDMVMRIELQCKQIDDAAVEARQEFDSTLNNKATELNDKFMSLINMGSERATRAEDIMDALATEVERNKRSFEDMCGQVEKKGVAAMQLLADQISDQSDNLLQIVGKVERNLEKMEVRQTDRSNELQTIFEDAQAAATAVVTELRIRLTTKLDELEEAVQKDHHYFVAECERIQQKASDESKSVDKKLVSTRSLLHEKLAKLSDDVAANLQQTTDTYDDLDAKYDMQCEDIRMRLKSQLEILSRELTEQTQELMKKDELLDAAIRQQHQHFTEVATDLRACHDTATGELEDRANRIGEDVLQVDKKFSAVCEELMEHFTALNTAMTQNLVDAKAQLDAKDAAIEESLHAKFEQLMVKDDALTASLQAEVEQRHDKINKLEKADAALMLEIESKSIKMDAAVAAVDSAADARDAAQTVRIEKLEADVTGKLMTSIEELERSITKDLNPLLKTVDDIGIKLVTVAEQAATADATATRLGLLQMDVKQLADDTKALVDRGDRDFEDLSGRLDATTSEVQDLALEFTGLELASMVDPS